MKHAPQPLVFSFSSWTTLQPLCPPNIASKWPYSQCRVNHGTAAAAGNAAAGPFRLSRQDGVKPEEADLIDRCKRHEPGAFEELYRLHAGRVYNLACRLTGSLSDGEDLMQEIFVQVFRKLDGFKGESAVGTWIYRLATNLCLDYPARTRGEGTQADRPHRARGHAAAARPRARCGRTASTSSGRLRGWRRGIGRRSCCTTSRGSSTTRWPTSWASPKARRSRRCTRRA